MLYALCVIGTPKYTLHEEPKGRKCKFHFLFAINSTKAKINDKTERFKKNNIREIKRERDVEREF